MGPKEHGRRCVLNKERPLGPFVTWLGNWLHACGPAIFLCGALHVPFHLAYAIVTELSYTWVSRERVKFTRQTRSSSLLCTSPP
ncbi:hypothetical protein VNO78_20566 [Psophocarpus tetragonolobus]|uniref:Uncharacterized protein n=1 Tax=Psophocarpus tetragonolobus TaxID=3891 RepID=A0AAN9XHB7_PSOTE